MNTRVRLDLQYWIPRLIKSRNKKELFKEYIYWIKLWGIKTLLKDTLYEFKRSK